MTKTRTSDEIDNAVTLDSDAVAEAFGATAEQTSTALATTTQAMPAVVEKVTTALADEDWLGVPDGHIGGAVKARLPRVLSNMKVGQKASAEQKASGFTDELTGEVFTEATFVWLGDTTTRAYFPLPFGEGDKEPACRAADGTNPDPSSPAQQPGWTVPTDRKGHDGAGEHPTTLCATCPNAKWQGDDTPPCSESIEVLVYLLDQQRLSLIRFGGMGVSRVRRYLGALEAHVPVRPPLAYVTKVELVERDTPNGTFLVPKFSPVGDIPRSEAEPLIALQKAKLTEWVEQLSADLAEGATREEGGGTAFGQSTGPFDEPRGVTDNNDPHAGEDF